MESVIAAVSGPFGALALCLFILYWIANKVVPVLQRYLESQSKQLAELVAALNRTIDAHEKDRASFERSIARLGGRLERVETDVSALLQATKATG